jgi:uncharacterized SAM-binding protein YcdF (DUF218 family)
MLRERTPGTRLALVATVLVLALASSASAGAIGDWLAVEDPLDRCPALVVLNGEHPGRADEAVRLYRAGFGREVWLTDDPRSSDATGDAGTRSNRRHLVAHGVPDAAIYVVPGAASGTRAELAIVAAELRRRAAPCAILITSSLHLRRVRATWQRVAGETPRAIVRKTSSDDYSGWRKEVAELALTLLAVIGLPR